MSTQAQKFVLVGPHAGKTMHVNGHEFIDGEYVFQGSHEQIATLTRIFENYAAMPAEIAELAELRTLAAAVAPVITPEAVAEVIKVVAETVPSVVSAEGAREAVATLPAGDAVINLGEAIGQLDPENDVHWTSNNLPSIEFVSELLGKKVARSEIEAVAEGYTRAKARAARG